MTSLISHDSRQHLCHSILNVFMFTGIYDTLRLVKQDCLGPYDLLDDNNNM